MEMSFTLACIAIILSVILLSYMFLSWNFSEYLGNKYLIARPLPLLGNIIAFSKQVRKFGFVDMHTHIKKIYGNIYGYVMFSKVYLTIHDSELLRHILITDFNNFPNRVDDGSFRILSRSLLLVKGFEWRKQRKLLSPAFSSGKLKEITPSIAACACKTAQRIRDLEKSKQSFDMKSISGGFTIDVIASSQFGLDTEAQNSENNLFITHAENIIKVLQMTTIEHAMRIFTTWFRGLIGKIKGKGMGFQSDDTYKFFQKMVRKTEFNHDDTKDIRPNIISILKSSPSAKSSTNHLISQPKLSEEEIVSNAALLIAAGFDTTANTLGFLFYFFALYPEVQDKALQEIKSVFEDDFNLCSEKLAQLKYLDMCINETLRIYPIAPVLTRETLSDYKYKDIEIRKNWLIIVPVRAIHMDPEIWPNPENFNPERFSQDAKVDRHPTSFIPFGAGPRSCIGIRLAFLEMKILVVELLSEFKFIKCEKTEEPIELNMIPGLLAPANGIWLKALLRENNNKQI